jgi:nitric oxide reductase subunit B
LHRESVFTLDEWARDLGAKDFASLPSEQQAGLQVRLQEQMRTNRYDAATDVLTISITRGRAFESLAAYYAGVFSRGRDEYAIPEGALTDAAKARQMSAFFWWTSWIASTNRPGTTASYTQNWPHEPLVNNTPTGSIVVWSVISFVLLLAGIGGMVWYFASQEREPHGADIPSHDPLLGLHATPSQRATVKFFFVVAALFVVQVGLGAVTAHYGVEGSSFYGIPLAAILP